MQLSKMVAIRDLSGRSPRVTQKSQFIKQYKSPHLLIGRYSMSPLVISLVLM